MYIVCYSKFLLACMSMNDIVCVGVRAGFYPVEVVGRK